MLAEGLASSRADEYLRSTCYGSGKYNTSSKKGSYRWCIYIVCKLLKIK